MNTLGFAKIIIMIVIRYYDPPDLIVTNGNIFLPENFGYCFIIS